LQHFPNDIEANQSSEMSSKESTSSDESSSAESSASSPQRMRLRCRRRARGTAASLPKSESPLPESSTQQNEVRGSKGDGGGEPPAQPSTGGSNVRRPSGTRGSSGRQAPQPIYRPQACRLCDRETVYLTRSGLSDHATIHHRHWYSAKQDRYVPIPEADLAAKRDLVKPGQTHRKFRQDPADVPNPTDGRDKPTGGRRLRVTGLRTPTDPKRRRDEPDPPVDDTGPPPDTREVVRRPYAPSER